MIEKTRRARIVAATSTLAVAGLIAIAVPAAADVRSGSTSCGYNYGVKVIANGTLPMVISVGGVPITFTGNGTATKSVQTGFTSASWYVNATTINSAYGTCA